MAAPNISLLNATYSSVSGVTLPKQGGGTATFPWVEGSQTITTNGTVNVTNLAEVVVNVSGGGSSKNVQICHGRYETNKSSYTATALTLTVSKAGTYKVSWAMDRNTTSGTNGSRLYKGSSAVGTVHTSWTHNGAVCEESLSLAANDVITVYARARNTSYYVGVSNLIIEEQ